MGGEGDRWGRGVFFICWKRRGEIRGLQRKERANEKIEGRGEERAVQEGSRGERGWGSTRRERLMCLTK